MSRSWASRVCLSHSSMSGIETLAPHPAPSAAGPSPPSSRPPKRESCPIASLRLISTYCSTAVSWIVTSARRRWFSESKAPALTSDSITRLLHTIASTLVRKSPKSVNRPFSRRAATTDSTTFPPTLRIALRPKRMSVPTGVKLESDSLTSGGSTLIPIRRHSLR